MQVFGVPLKVLMKREKECDVPMLVDKAIKFIYDYGLKQEGVFRLSGRATQIEALRDQLDRGKKVFFSEDMDVNSVASLFKQWLRELPEPLLTYPLFGGFIDAAADRTLLASSVQLVHADGHVFTHLLRCTLCLLMYRNNVVGLWCSPVVQRTRRARLPS